MRITSATEFGQLDAFVLRMPSTTDRSQAKVFTKRPHGQVAGPMAVSQGKKPATRRSPLEAGGGMEAEGGKASAAAQRGTGDVTPTDTVGSLLHALARARTHVQHTHNHTHNHTHIRSSLFSRPAWK